MDLAGAILCHLPHSLTKSVPSGLSSCLHTQKHNSHAAIKLAICLSGYNPAGVPVTYRVYQRVNVQIS